MIKVWLDDERPMPKDFDVHVKTFEAAVAFLNSGKVIEISLDHDLGTEQTGYDVALFIEKGAALGTIGRIKVTVHSANPVGAKNILMAIESAQRFWDKSRN